MQMKALVLDDEPDVLSIIIEALASNNFQAVGVISPREALALVKKEHFSVIITDLMLPDMDGFEFIHQVRTVGIRIPIIALSGLADAGEFLFAQKDGRPRARPDVTLAKPFSYQAFFNTLNEVADRIQF